MFTTIEITAMAQRIKAGLNCRVFLFGSYAWGSPNEDSDLDFAVVVPDDEYVRRIDIKARKLAQHGLIPIDVLAYRSSTFKSSVQGTLSFEIRTKGVEL